MQSFTHFLNGLLILVNDLLILVFISRYLWKPWCLFGYFRSGCFDFIVTEILAQVNRVVNRSLFTREFANLIGSIFWNCRSYVFIVDLLKRSLFRHAHIIRFVVLRGFFSRRKPFLATIPTIHVIILCSVHLGSVVCPLLLISRVDIFRLVLIRWWTYGIIHFGRIIIRLISFCSEIDSIQAIIVNDFIFRNRLLFNTKFFLHGI